MGDRGNVVLNGEIGEMWYLIHNINLIIYHFKKPKVTYFCSLLIHIYLV